MHRVDNAEKHRKLMPLSLKYIQNMGVKLLGYFDYVLKGVRAEEHN